MNLFNKTSAGFLVRFALILGASFAVLFVVNFYIMGSEPQVAQPQTSENSQR